MIFQKNTKTIVDIGCNDGLYSFECLKAVLKR